MSYNESINSNSNYPPMSQSQWDSAPFNERETPEKKFNIVCSQTLSKNVSVYTNDYIEGASGVEYETDEEGHKYAISYRDEDDTSDTNWNDVYAENKYHTPLQLIQLFNQFLKEQYAKGIVFKSPYFTEHLIEECDGWIDDECTIFRE